MSTNKKLCLVCSTGGHLLQLYSLNRFWERYERVWVTFCKDDSQYLLRKERRYYAFFPTQRNIVNFVRNTVLALTVLKREKPDVIISTGAGVGVPFVVIGKLMGIKTVWVESVARVKTLSLSARLLYPLVDELLVAWEELAARYKKANYKGSIL